MDDWRLCLDCLYGSSLYLGHGGCDSNIHGNGAVSCRHGYGYVYRYPMDMDTAIQYFIEKSDMWIRFIIFFKNKMNTMPQ
jgi:hypothetical protein